MGLWRDIKCFNHLIYTMNIMYIKKGCTPGYYGPKCKSKCFGYCKDNEPCNHISGLCDNGCYDGWTGENCTTGKTIHIDK